MYICLESNLNPETHGGNSPASFTCTLPEHYILNQSSKSGKWHIALLEIGLPPFKTNQKSEGIYVCCSACQPSCIGDIYRPVLASLSVGEIKRNNCMRFDPVQYVPLRASSLSELTIEICGKDGEPLEHLHSIQNDALTSRCTLVLKWIPTTSPWLP